MKPEQFSTAATCAEMLRNLAKKLEEGGEWHHVRVTVRTERPEDVKAALIRKGRNLVKRLGEEVIIQFPDGEIQEIKPSDLKTKC